MTQPQQEKASRLQLGLTALAVLGLVIVGTSWQQLEGLTGFGAGRSQCMTAYEHAHYRGRAMTFCTNGYQDGSFINDSWSSIKLDPGVAIKVCEHSNAGGKCFSYFSSVPWIGSNFNDMASWATIWSFNPSNFKIIMASDPQIFWSECDGDIGKGGCANNGNESKESIAHRTNQNHVDSMNQIQAENSTSLVGLILNGDLTAFGHGNEFDAYKSYYHDKLNMNVYPGLGNHDYGKNNVNDCWENGCARRMVDYINETVEDLNVTGYDWSISSTYYKWPEFRKDHTGSLSYSWDVGPIHFVQLHNFPQYQNSFNGWNFGGARRDFYEIQSSVEWLKNDLRQALEQNKKVVLNYHVPGLASAAKADNKGDWTIYSGPFKDVLDAYGQSVVAIFVGHYHSWINKQRTITVGSHKIPMIWGGAALYHHYVVATFNGDTMTIEQIDSSGGSNYSVTKTKNYDIGFAGLKDCDNNNLTIGTRDSHQGNGTCDYQNPNLSCKDFSHDGGDCSQDCAGKALSSVSAIGDGVCNSNGPDLACSKFSNDGGDCSRDCGGQNLSSVGQVGDDYCDRGSPNLNCGRFNNDGGDCSRDCNHHRINESFLNRMGNGKCNGRLDCERFDRDGGDCRPPPPPPPRPWYCDTWWGWWMC